MVRRTVAVVGRQGRGDVRVRVAGYRSLGWIEVVRGWGARVEAVVGDGSRMDPEINRRFAGLSKLFASNFCDLPPEPPWDGLCVGTVVGAEDAGIVSRVIAHWQPLIVVLAFPGNLSRKELKGLMPRCGKAYQEKRMRVRHCDVGGVTMAQWHVLHATRDRVLKKAPQETLMMSPSYPRTLQTVLDDTLPCKPVVVTEMRSSGEDSVVGEVRERAGTKTDRRAVHSAAGRVPDISNLPYQQRLLWVRMRTIWSREPRVRKLVPRELLAMWDYEGKLESRDWSEEELERVICSRMASPPGKILRALAHPALDFLLGRGGCPGGGLPPARPRLVTAGKTVDVPTSVLERKIGAGAAATRPNDAGIDLSIWAVPRETKAEAGAR